MTEHAQLEALFAKHGFTDFKWIDPHQIVVAQWVRMKCLFGCPEYGKTGTCPPFTPSVAECERFFREYRTAAIFHFEKRVARPQDRHAWTRRINLRLTKLEREVFLGGYVRAFLLWMDSCTLCKKCAGSRADCKSPHTARPTPEAMAIDVFSTVLRAGYPIEVLPEVDRMMNRYAFLLLE